MNFERGQSTKDGLNIGIFRDRKRKTGKTTKTVDDAIQFLFKSGNICIPTYSKITLINGMPRSTIINDFIDPDARLNHAVQENLWRRILDRLKYEHGSNNIIIDNKRRVIKLEN